MSKKFWKKFLKIKITVVAALFIGLLVFLQLPWVKHEVIKRVKTELSTLTESQVDIGSYQALVPLNFEIYDLTFEKEGVVWLTVDHLSLNRSLLYFIFWKKKGLDLSIYSAHLKALPNNEKKSEPPSWPQRGASSLNVHLTASKVNIDEKVFNQKLPQEMHFRVDLSLSKGGRFFRVRSNFQSQETPHVILKVNARGYQKLDRVHLDLELLDPNSELKNNFNLPEVPFKFRTSLSGSPSAYFAFFHPQYSTDQFFRGSLNLQLLKSHKDNLFLDELTQNHPLTLQSELYFDNQGLDVRHLHTKGEFFDLNGGGFLDRSHEFKETYLEGKVSSLDFTQKWLSDPIEGTFGALVTVKGPYNKPSLYTKLLSEKVAYKHYVCYGFQSELSFDLFSEQFCTDFSFEGALNQSPLSGHGLFCFTSNNHFTFEDTALSYGENKFYLPTLKKMDALYQGRLSCDCKKLSLLSTFLQKELHGDLEGEATLDVDVTSDGLIQIGSTHVSGTLFEYPQTSLSSYQAQFQGKVLWTDLFKSKGELQISSEETHLKSLSWDSLDLHLDTLTDDYRYKVQTRGDVDLLSTGIFNHQDGLWKVDLREAKGHIRHAPFAIMHSTNIEFKKDEILNFSPILFKVGGGQLYLYRDGDKDEAILDLKNFPIEAVSYFVPGFDARGDLTLKGELSKITTQARGKLTGKVTRFRVEDFQDHKNYIANFDLTLGKNSLNIEGYVGRDAKDYTKFDMTLPFSFSLLPLNYNLDKEASIKGKLDYIGPINPFISHLIPQNHLVEADTDIDLTFKGSLKEPKIEGYANFEHLYYENLYLGLVLKDVDLSMEAHKNKLLLTQFHAYDADGGEVSAEGDLTLSFKKHFPYDIKFNAQNIQVVQFAYLSATILGEGKIEGNFNKGFLQGKFDVTKAIVNLPGSGGSDLPKLDVTYIYPREEIKAESFTRQTKPKPIYFDVDLNILDQTEILGRGLDSYWTGKLSIKGSDILPKFKGEIESYRGTFDFAGRLFELREGKINLDGNFSKDMSINLYAAQQISGHLVHINLKGPLLSPYLTYRSDPTLSKKEILSLVLFGQTAERLTPFQAVALTHTLATLGGVYTGPGAINKLRKGIGLDQLSLGAMMYNNKDYTTIQVGKYISRSILITLNRPLTPNASPFVLTAQFGAGFQLQTYFDENEISQILAQWRFSY